MTDSHLSGAKVANDVEKNYITIDNKKLYNKIR